MKNNTVVICLYLAVLGMSSCASKTEKTEIYIAIYKRDTVTLALDFYDDSFHGRMEVKGVGNDKESGHIRGKINGDTLVGDFIYTPYKARNEKRRALVLLRQSGQLIQGTGLENIYMGMPYYLPSSINFDNPKFVFKRLK